MAPTPTDRRALRAKHPGTGLLDTPPEAWAALFRDYLRSRPEPLSDVAKRHRIRYSAAVERVRRDGWMDWRDGLVAAMDLWAREDVRRMRHALCVVERALATEQRVLASARSVGLVSQPTRHQKRDLVVARNHAPTLIAMAEGPTWGVAPPAAPALDVRAAVVDLAAYRAQRRRAS